VLGALGYAATSAGRVNRQAAAEPVREPAGR
jgi:hypothetical protein